MHKKCSSQKVSRKLSLAPLGFTTSVEEDHIVMLHINDFNVAKKSDLGYNALSGKAALKQHSDTTLTEHKADCAHLIIE